MGATITDPAEPIPTGAADLIEACRWDRLANRCATGALSVLCATAPRSAL
jgi:hypothetical protein